MKGRFAWLKIFIGGLVLLFLVERTLLATSNPNFVPSVILFGAFLVPVAFTAYLYQHLPDWEVPLPTVALCFLYGGVLGTVIAGTLEYDAMRNFGPTSLLGVGIIEEGAKLILPVTFYLLGRYRSEASGIILGVSTAMGFAALETMGYGFVAFLQSRGNVGLLDEVLLVRGLLSPAGHASWTGIVCAVLFKQRQMGRAALGLRVISVFFLAALLHLLYDLLNFGASGATVSAISLNPLSLVVAVVSLTLLILRVREARRGVGGCKSRSPPRTV